MVDSVFIQQAVLNFSRFINATVNTNTDSSGVPTLKSYNVSFYDLPAAMNPRPNSTYTVDQVAALALENWLPRILKGIINFEVRNQILSGDVVQAIWSKSEDLDGWIKSVAASMTNVVRTYNTTSDEGHNGIGYQQGIHVLYSGPG